MMFCRRSLLVRSCLVAGTLLIGVYIIFGGTSVSRRKKRKRKDAIPGLANIGNSCFLNALVQSLASCPTFVSWLSNRHTQQRAPPLLNTLNNLLKALNNEGESNGDACAGEVLGALRGHGWVITSEEQDTHELFHVLTATIEDEIITGAPVPSLLDVSWLDKGQEVSDGVAMRAGSQGVTGTLGDGTSGGSASNCRDEVVNGIVCGPKSGMSSFRCNENGNIGDGPKTRLTSVNSHGINDDSDAKTNTKTIIGESLTSRDCDNGEISEDIVTKTDSNANTNATTEESMTSRDCNNGETCEDIVTKTDGNANTNTYTEESITSRDCNNGEISEDIVTKTDSNANTNSTTEESTTSELSTPIKMTTSIPDKKTQPRYANLIEIAQSLFIPECDDNKNVKSDRYKHNKVAKETLSQNRTEGESSRRKSRSEHHQDIPFRGYLASQLQCTLCGHKNPAQWSSFESLSLSLPSLPWSEVTLQELLGTYITREQVSGVTCDGCSRVASSPVKTTFTKQLTIGKLPECLCFHVKRTMWLENGSAVKRRDHVTFPEYLVMDPYTYTTSITTQAGKQSVCEGNGGPSLLDNITVFSQQSTVTSRNSRSLLGVGSVQYDQLYRLQAVIVHVGDVFCGHFVTYRRGPVNSHSRARWFYASDLLVREATLEEVRKANAYMILYEKVDH